MGDRAAHLFEAIRLIAGYTALRAISRLYETAPLYDTAQPRFLNCVVAVAKAPAPEQLLRKNQEVEHVLGRRRDPARPKGPRPVDIDIVLYGGLTVESENPALRIPHPGLSERAFVLKPLLELAPELADPRNGSLLRNALEELPEQDVYLYHEVSLY